MLWSSRININIKDYLLDDNLGVAGIQNMLIIVMDQEAGRKYIW